MTEEVIAYLRRRARYHRLQAAAGAQDVACIHRRFARLYTSKAITGEADGVSGDENWLGRMPTVPFPAQH